ncbi:MAG: histidine kinase [Bacteroidota bacterium]
MPRSILYWICQAIGWGLYIIFMYAMMLLFGGGDKAGLEMQAFYVIIGLSMLLASHVLRWVIKKYGWTELPLKKLLPKILISIPITATFAQTIIHIIIYQVVDFSFIVPFSFQAFIAYTITGLLPFTLWSLLYFIYHYFLSNQQNKLDKMALKAALNEAELAILKNQINPHFLFNALNNIRSLILSDPDKARDMVTHISDLLRYSIQFNASEKVTLSKELDIVKDYLELESIQFGRRLRYDFEIDESASDVKVPPMTVQLLVENAIKHGISQSKEGGEVNIIASKNEDHVLIKVVNDGQLAERSKREGIGLKNLLDRMKILFGHFADLELQNSSSNKVTASLKIPVL